MKEPVVFFAWQTPAEIQSYRGRTWWMFATIIAIAFFAYALLTANFAFAVMLVMFGIIMVIAKPNPEPIDVVIADQGVLIGKNLYEFSTIKEYSIVEDEGLLYLYTKGILSSHTHVRLPDDLDYQDLRLVLQGRVQENPDRKSVPVIDSIAKKLKLF